MKEISSTQKLCSFYVSNMHFATMILPFVNKQIKEKTSVVTFLENNFTTNIELVLSRLTISDEVKKDAVDLKPALELISHISFVKDVEKGTSISYGGTFVAPKKMRIATIPVGYGDGYPRSLSNKGYVLIHGKRADIVGRVCMDQFMVDVTEIPEAKFMDPVTLVGKDNDAVIRVEDLSDLSGRFNYEFVCDLSKRVPREYYKNGTIVKQIDYFE